MEKGKKEDGKEMDLFSIINKKEQQIKMLPVGGISGIKSVKTSKKFFMTAPDHSKTNFNDK